MISVFVGETGGTIAIEDTQFTALRFCKIIGPEYTEFVASGIIASGVVYIPKRTFSTVSPGYYTVLLAGDITPVMTKQYSYDVQVKRRH